MGSTRHRQGDIYESFNGSGRRQGDVHETFDGCGRLERDVRVKLRICIPVRRETTKRNSTIYSWDFDDMHVLFNVGVVSKEAF